MYRGKGRDMQINTQTSAAGYPGTGAAGIFSTKVYSAKNTEAAEASKRAEKEPTDQEQFRLATDAYKENHRLTVEKTKKEDDCTKTWTITAFTPDGIICNECSDGKPKELWRLDYKNRGDCQKVWDYLAKFDKDEELDFASDKKFWEGFLGM